MRHIEWKVGPELLDANATPDVCLFYGYCTVEYSPTPLSSPGYYMFQHYLNKLRIV